MPHTHRVQSAPTEATDLRRGRVYDIVYRCRPMGYDPDDVEDGEVRAYWTGEIDTWGKCTWVPVDGGRPLYLFRDEVMYMEEV